MWGRATQHQPASSKYCCLFLQRSMVGLIANSLQCDWQVTVAPRSWDPIGRRQQRPAYVALHCVTTVVVLSVNWFCLNLPVLVQVRSVSTWRRFRILTLPWGWMMLVDDISAQAAQGPMWAREHCRISPPCFLAKCRMRRLNQASFVLLYFVLCWVVLSFCSICL